VAMMPARIAKGTALVASTMLAANPLSAQARQRWNLISIMTDDQAAWSVRAYGNAETVTPNMDRLAREGARFTAAFASSGVCTPNRVAFFTGLYPIETGMPDVPSRRDMDAGLPPGVPFWPRELQRHGYVTGLIGKWHLGELKAHYPTRYGFDYFFGFLRGSNLPMNPVMLRDGKPVSLRGPEPDLLVDDAVRFLEQHRGRPFALLLHFRAPHAPHLPVPAADLAPFKNLDPTVPIVDPAVAVLDDDQEPADPEAIALHTRLLKDKMRTYYASVHSVDRNIGRLLAKMDELDLTRKTIVLFTSDQGYLFGHRGLKGKGSAQPIRNHTLANDAKMVNMYDVALRVPLMVRWPGVVRPGAVIDQLVSNVDTYATVLSMLSVPKPSRAPAQSRDFTPLLRGEPVAWRDTIFAEYTPDQIGAMQFIRMIRTSRWKLVRTYLNGGGNELYDLKNDPEELHNLYHDWRRGPLETDSGQSRRVANPYAPVRDSLQKRLAEWQRSIGDPALELDARYAEVRRRMRERWSR